MRIAALIVLPTLLASGCGTICNLASRDPDFFGGVQGDVSILTGSSGGGSGANKTMAFIAGFIAAHAGLSLVADTLTLPVVHYMRYRESEKEEEQPPD